MVLRLLNTHKQKKRTCSSSSQGTGPSNATLECMYTQEKGNLAHKNSVHVHNIILIAKEEKQPT